MDSSTTGRLSQLGSCPLRPGPLAQPACLVPEGAAREACGVHGASPSPSWTSTWWSPKPREQERRSQLCASCPPRAPAPARPEGTGVTPSVNRGFLVGTRVIGGRVTVNETLPSPGAWSPCLLSWSPSIRACVSTVRSRGGERWSPCLIRPRGSPPPPHRLLLTP